jgi:hypothetical protein
LTVEIRDGSCSSFSRLSVGYNAYVDLIYPSTSVIFRHRDGLPIKISTKVVAILEARCSHGIDNNLSVVTKPNKIEWRIEGEKKSSGAFKVGHSDQAEYLSRDYGESVIYHPPLELTTTPKKIEMKVKMTHAAAGDLQYRISIDLQLQRGFGKGLSSLANITLTPANQANVRPIENRKCGICKPELVFDKPYKLDKPNNLIALAGIVENDKCLMTSEYIKMISRADEKGQIWLTSSGGEQVSLGGLSPDYDLKWQCSAGKFVGSNTGRSVIYLTPDESGLSKSPVSIALQEEDGRTLDSRRFWLLRRPSIMHC